MSGKLFLSLVLAMAASVPALTPSGAAGPDPEPECTMRWSPSDPPEAQLAAALQAATSLALQSSSGAGAPRPAVATRNARDFPTLEAALAAVPDGGALYVPTGDWKLAQHTKTGALRVDPSRFHRGIQIFGDGPGTRLIPRDADTDAIVFDQSKDPNATFQANIVIRDLQVAGNASRPGRGGGIRFLRGELNRKFFRVTLDRVEISGVGSTGLELQSVVFGLLQDVNVQECRAGGILVIDSNMITLRNVYAHGCNDAGMRAERTYCLTVLGSAFEDNQRSQEKKYDPIDAQVTLITCHGVVFLGCDFEEFVRARSKTGMYVGNSTGVLVQSNTFVQSGAADPKLQSVYVDAVQAAPTGAVLVGSNSHRNVSVLATVSPEARDVIVLGQFGDRGAVNMPRDDRAKKRGLVDLPERFSKKP